MKYHSIKNRILGALVVGVAAAIHIKAFDLPPQEEKLVITTAGILELGEVLARGYLEHTH